MHIIEHEINANQLKAIGDKIIVIVDALPVRSEFIITPEYGGRKPVTGIVISRGSRVTYVEEGDRVFFTRFTGREFIYNRDKFQILVENEVFAIIPNEMECEEIAGTRI